MHHIFTSLPSRLQFKFRPLFCCSTSWDALFRMAELLVQRLLQRSAAWLLICSRNVRLSVPRSQGILESRSMPSSPRAHSLLNSTAFGFPGLTEVSLEYYFFFKLPLYWSSFFPETIHDSSRDDPEACWEEDTTLYSKLPLPSDSNLFFLAWTWEPDSLFQMDESFLFSSPRNQPSRPSGHAQTISKVRFWQSWEWEHFASGAST